jgi:hypothetical protein
MPLRRFGLRLPSMPHRLLALRLSSLRGTATMLVNPMRPWHVPRDSDCSKPHPFALRGDQVTTSPFCKGGSRGFGCRTRDNELEMHTLDSPASSKGKSHPFEVCPEDQTLAIGKSILDGIFFAEKCSSLCILMSKSLLKDT